MSIIDIVKNEGSRDEGSLLRRTCVMVATMVIGVVTLLGTLSVLVLFVSGRVNAMTASSAQVADDPVAPAAAGKAAKTSGASGGAAALQHAKEPKLSHQPGHEI